MDQDLDIKGFDPFLCGISGLDTSNCLSVGQDKKKGLTTDRHHFAFVSMPFFR